MKKRIHILLASFGFGLAAVLLLSSTRSTSANTTNPYLWPYNQATNVNFNEADVYSAWTTWRDARITANNAGGNGRYRVMGGVGDSTTVSEGMAYGMLFSSLFDEQDLFDGLYLFAKDHFNENGVMDWHIGAPGVRVGSGGATDAEVDMGIALINACVKVDQNAWPASPAGLDYCAEATSMINAIYNFEVDHPGSAPPAGLPNNLGNELIPGDTWNLSEEYPNGIINLSYFPPGYFTVFGKFTNNVAAWEAVNDRNYEVTDIVQAQPDNCSGLVPNWNTYDGAPQLVSWQPQNYSWWSYDAARFAWRIAVDQAWYGRPEATETINEIGGFFSSTGFNNIGEHSMDGVRRGSGPWPFFVANAAAAVWAAPNPTAVTCGSASGTLLESPQSAYDRVLSTSGPANDYYGNAWRLFSMLLMTGNFPNFYEMAYGDGVPPTSTPAPPTATPDVTTEPPSPTATSIPNGNGACVVDYVIANQWGDGFQADVTITNNTANAVDGYQLTWTHAAGQTVSSGWNVSIAQQGNDVTASNPAGSWNGLIGANGGSVSFGFQGSLSGGLVIPTDFALNGVVCNDNTNNPDPTPLPPTATPVVPTATAVPPTATSVPPTVTAPPPTATSAPPTATPNVLGGCHVDYAVNDWGSGFTAELTITNQSAAMIDGWTLTWSFAGNQTLSNHWNAVISESGGNLSATNVAHNGVLSANGGTAAFGFNASYSGTNAAPTDFVLNGVACSSS